MKKNNVLMVVKKRKKVQVVIHGHKTVKRTSKAMSSIVRGVYISTVRMQGCEP
jgi:phosphotransferase system IIB component